MKFVRASVVVGAASLLIGVPAASAAPSVSIHVKKREIVYLGKPTKITGHVGGVSPKKGLEVRIYSSPYPYNGFTYEASKRTDSKGNYSFTTGPDRNTLFFVKVVKTGTASARRFVYVDAIVNLKVATTKSNHARPRLRFTFAPQLGTSAFTGVPLYWYFRVDGKGSKKFRRVGKTTTHRYGAGVIGGSFDYKLPSSVGKSKYTMRYCFQPKKKGDVGIGIPGKAFPKCK